MAGTGHYNTKGLYNRYDKKHKERDALDYYATPPAEVKNFLSTYGENFSNLKILEPCCGEGHMLKGILDYCVDNDQEPIIISTDVKQRESLFGFDNSTQGLEYDFLADNYPNPEPDWIIMNPPYGIIEPFTIRALEIAKTGVIMLGRLQFLEGEGRYTNIFAENPPNYIYTYVDRIQCWKNGVEPKGSSAQGYSWFVWDKRLKSKDSIHRWLRRVDKI